MKKSFCFFFQKEALASLLAASLLTSCTVGPNFHPPQLNLPARFTEAAASQAATNAQLARWWRSFHDPMLNALIRQAIAGNLDIGIAAQRLAQARAERDQVAAGDYPTVDAVGTIERARSSTTLAYPPGIGPYHGFITGFDASWELDVFGENRRAREAAEDQVLGSLATRRALLVSLLSEVAADYATLRAAQLRLAIAQRNVRTARQVLDLASREYTHGLASDLAMLQARSQLESTQAALPSLQAEVAVMAHAIGVLLGRYPGDLEAKLSRPRPLMPVPSGLPVSVPAEVIANRPDVRAAELRYAAANAEIGVAIAERLPHFSIPLSLTPSSSAISSLFSAASLTYSLALSGVQHVYEGGRLRAKERAARAAAEGARLNYDKTVLTALQEVEDALVRVRTERRTHQSLVASLRDAETALGHATRLYHAGLTDFLTVLTAERQVFAARNALAISSLALVQDYIALFKALGGGWQTVDFSHPAGAGAGLVKALEGAPPDLPSR